MHEEETPHQDPNLETDYDDDEMDYEEERVELDSCYGNGANGPFPITFYSEAGKVYYEPLEFDTRGPFDSLEQAKEEAEGEFGGTCFGFYESSSEAEEAQEDTE